MTHVILDHSILGQSATSLTINKERRYAGCRICGELFQPDVLREVAEPTLLELLNAEVEIAEWRTRHNRRHSESVHRQLASSGRAFTPDAAYRLAPFGIASITDALSDDEVAQAMREAPRAPADDVEGSTTRRR